MKIQLTQGSKTNIRIHTEKVLIKTKVTPPNPTVIDIVTSKYKAKTTLSFQQGIQDEEKDEHKFTFTGQEFPWEGYTNWQPVKNSNLLDHNNCNSRSNYEFSNQNVDCLEDLSEPKKNKSEKIKDKSIKTKKNKEEKNIFWIAQNKKLFPSLQAHLAHRYQV
ncbi:hypothetical protein O181_120401 [Austropuccinia psidii MF-1]|uniref:Uncharacterized protein n=1 Tax=Austropuccinia psidii MF-1 TaxID=1389203 RepID=A0A9Q3Q0J3_9BASI|nr:hypothetical protein [Austropuccinia psidii MF-1]